MQAGKDSEDSGGWSGAAGLLRGVNMRCVLWGLLSGSAPEDLLTACLRAVGFPCLNAVLGLAACA